MNINPIPFFSLELSWKHLGEGKWKLCLKDEWQDVKRLDGARAVATGPIEQCKASKYTLAAIVVQGSVPE